MIKLIFTEILKAVTSKSKGFWLLWDKRKPINQKHSASEDEDKKIWDKNVSKGIFKSLKYCKVHLSKSTWCLLSTGSLLSPLRKGPWSMAASLVVARCQKSCGGWSSIAAADSPIYGSLGTYSFPSYHGNKGVIIGDYLSLKKKI